MGNEQGQMPPLMWANANSANNVVVLTADTLYVATVKPEELAAIDLGLEEGKSADSLLPAKAKKVPLAQVERIQYKQARVKVHEMANKDLTVSYDDGSKSRNLSIETDSEATRDGIVKELNQRLGDWLIDETPESPWIILVRYLFILMIVVLVTIGLSALLISGVITRAPAFIAWYINLTGVWGIVVPGFLIAIVVLVTGIRQLATPPMIVSYEPDEDDEDE